MKKVPQRMCVVCREMKPKKDLIRVVLGENNEIVLDETGRANGRGAYVCASECVHQLEKRKSFERALSGKLQEGLVEKIKDKVNV